MITLVKLQDGTIAELIKIQDVVEFSKTRGWILLGFDFELQDRRRINLKWVSLSTKFTWVRTFNFG
jgi:hypothetical protein